MFNREEFNAALAIRGMSIEATALRSGINMARLYRRFKDGLFTILDVYKLMIALELSEDEIMRIFLGKSAT